jgi:hypothetical protein
MLGQTVLPFQALNQDHSSKCLKLRAQKVRNDYLEGRSGEAFDLDLERWENFDSHGYIRRDLMGKINTGNRLKRSSHQKTQN